ncbi:enoyl-CoA hydratase/isomerase family protein [Microbacterium sp. RG1]|uniref:enoyl-CoA hydratase/isomerase family protein n=1 Tax=Microbacterium sp. RG1 TaxID=2489212 RepID=UPI0010CA2B84|nr:enoyl-CoA hydratase/isomerase family protein [Microbacterium sp. RG1]QCQ17817.1 enoyl-CoA hydratase/isomerase family protein [Microbacterium sp. RG1]
MSGADATVLVRSDQGVGRLTLNRPRALNAVDIDMVRRLAGALDAWEHDADVEVVLLDGAGDRGFCAGGDVRLLREQAMSSDAERTADFFLAEYALNARLAEYPKPVVTIADGITMGGGVGLASHAGHRVVTERSQLAMPETRIGFTPDVGGTWLLAHAPGRIGEYLALTGGTMDAADAIYAGFADHLVPSDRIDAFRDALETRADPQGPAELVLLFDETPDTSRLETARAWIDDAFAADSVSEILARLRAHPEPDAVAAAELIAALSPTALTVTLEAVRRARRRRSLREVLEQEYGLVMWFALTQPDLVEGIRAQLVDKDRSPRWHPAALDELDPAIVDQAFAFRPPRTLWG